MAIAIARTRLMKAGKVAASRDWKPSDSAASGLRMYLDHHAVGASGDAGEGDRRDQVITGVPCEGSTMTGRSLRSFSSDTAAMSRLFLVDGSKVRLPRSQITT